MKLLLKFFLLFAAHFMFLAWSAEPTTTANPNVDAAKKLEFDDQSISALDPDYGKLDLTSLKDKGGNGGRLYPVRTSFRKEQTDSIGSWGIVE